MATPNAAPALRFSAQARLRALQMEIIDLILERGLDAGDPLPTEQELASELGVGRNATRECLKVLQGLGIIEIRHGYGMFVAPSNFDALTDALTFRGRLSLRHEGHEAMELVEIRQALESGLVASSIEAMTPDQLARIEDAVRTMEERAARGEEFSEADARFHSLLFEPLGNGLLLNLLEVFWKVYRKIHAEVDPGASDFVEIAAMHRKIFDAIAAGDKAAASERLNRHFDGIRRVLSERQAG
jgi:DNA-binding FadR family transcriptional regulator